MVEGKTSILVMVGRFSKHSIFIVSPNLFSSEITIDLFYINVVKFFGLVIDILSDRENMFLVGFGKHYSI